MLCELGLLSFFRQKEFEEVVMLLPFYGIIDVRSPNIANSSTYQRCSPAKPRLTFMLYLMIKEISFFQALKKLKTMIFVPTLLQLEIWY